jgi:hypothetical protein
MPVTGTVGAIPSLYVGMKGVEMGNGKKAKISAAARAEIEANQLAARFARARRRGEEKAGPDTPLHLANGGWGEGAGRDGFVGRDGHREKFICHSEDGSIEEHWLAVPTEERRCTGIVKTGPYRDQRCRRPALRGARVCNSHGAQLPNVKRAAQRRIQATGDLAAQALIYLAFDKPNVKDGDRLKALLALLERAGLDGKQTMTIEVKPWQQALQAVADGKRKKLKDGTRKKSKPVIDDDEDVTTEESFAHWEDDREDD